MNKLEIKYINIKDIKRYNNNPRQNDDAVPYVMNSIKKFGFRNPVILDKNNIIVCGHTRISACERLGIEEIPCLYADDLTDEQIKAFRLADNKTAEMAGWDFPKLEEELAGITDIDMSEMGFMRDIKNQLENDEKENDLSFNNKYQIIISFENEEEMKNAYEKLSGKYQCKISTL